jgi:hypothetical protein
MKMTLDIGSVHIMATDGYVVLFFCLTTVIIFSVGYGITWLLFHKRSKKL